MDEATDLGEPSIDGTKMIIMIFGALCQRVHLYFQRISFTFVLLHLSPYSFLLKTLQEMRRSAQKVIKQKKSMPVVCKKPCA